MNNFQLFLADVKRALDRQEISRNDVAYINLDHSLWTSYDGFFSMMKEPTPFWKNFAKTSFGTWENVPNTFRVVMHDQSWLEYYTNIDDEYYSGFIFRRVPIRAPAYLDVESDNKN